MRSHEFLVCAASSLAMLLTLGQAEIFTSMLQFKEVLHTEDALATQLNAFVEQEEERLAELRQIAADYQEHSRQALEDSDKYLGNPLNAFLLVKRFTTDWNRVANKIRNEEANNLILNAPYTLPYFPDENDMNGVARALLRLQDTYALDTAKLARGEIKGFDEEQQLNGDDCFQLGRVAYNSDDYYHAILWFQQALASQREEDADHTIISKTLDYLAFSLYMQGNIHAAMNITREWIKYEPDSERAHANIISYENRLRDGPLEENPGLLKNDRLLYGYRAESGYADYEALCRGEKVQEYHLQHKLYCFYKREHPYYKLRPLKVEVMYFDPYIQVFHDLISDTEINTVKEIATPQLHTSMLFKTHRVDPEKRLHDVRVSMSAWLADDIDWRIARLSQKVEFATGLSVYPAESMQVLNYGLGGHYEPHLDFGQIHEDRSDLPDFVNFGNRISTSLYYMNDVAAGGNTVFTDIGVHVPPEKGMMLHWYNLMRNGEGDYRTIHAGCPVLAGTKWVCNKWIHERGQDFRRPCTLNENE